MLTQYIAERSVRVPEAEDEPLLGVAEPLAHDSDGARPARRLRYARARLPQPYTAQTCYHSYTASL